MAQGGQSKRPTRQRKKRRIDSAPAAAEPLISSAESSSSESEASSSAKQKTLNKTKPPNVKADIRAVVHSRISKPPISKPVPTAADAEKESSSDVSSKSDSDSASASESSVSASAASEATPDVIAQQAPKSSPPKGQSKGTPADVPKTAAEQKYADFESWYLRAMTTEFGDDLDKVRQAPDFKSSSVPMLVKALKQGVEVFSERDREVILGGRR